MDVDTQEVQEKLLRDLTHQLRQADRRADPIKIRELTLNLLYMRGLKRIESSKSFSLNDYILIDQLGLDLQKEQLHRLALPLWLAARTYAEISADGYKRTYFDLRGAQSCIALVALKNAKESLARALALRVPSHLDNDSQECLVQARHLQFRESKTEILAELRVFALFTLGRYWAARGKLAWADLALTRVLSLGKKHDVRETNLGEVALFLAEIRLDRAEFPGFQALLQAWSDDNSGPWRRWRLLEAYSLLLRGSFSQARETYASLRQYFLVMNTELPLSLSIQYIHLLTFLNRLEEAEELIVSLEKNGTMPASDINILRSLWMARRNTSAEDFHIPPAPGEEESAEYAPDSQFQEPPAEIKEEPFPPDRKRERVLDEWTILSNQIQLDLHDGHVERACRQCLLLGAWALTIDSKLIQAKQIYLCSLTTYYLGNAVQAEAFAKAAMDHFCELDMTHEAWRAGNLLHWSRRRLKAPEEEINEIAEQLKILLAQTTGLLSHEDKVLYKLNKWSGLDTIIAVECKALRRDYPDRSGRSKLDNRRLRGQTRGLLVKFLKERSWGDADQRGQPSPSSEYANPDSIAAMVKAQLFLRRNQRASSIPAPYKLKKDTGVVFYFVLPDRIETILMTRKICCLLPVMMRPRQEIWRRLDTEFLMSMPKSKDLIWLAEALSLETINQMLAPSVNRLVIVPDNVLIHIPFAALPLQGGYLVDRFILAILPRPGWNIRSLKPVRKFETATFVGLTKSEYCPDHPPLEKASDDIAGILTSVKAEDDPEIKYQDKDACRDRVMARLLKSTSVYFACHSEYKTDEPHRSGILLNDNWLTVYDIYTLDLVKMDFAFMNSCYGANFKVLPGGEAIGLPMAWLAGGSQLVITSLQEVDDEIAGTFSAAFYENLASVEPVEALARTQREYIGKPDLDVWGNYLAFIQGLEPWWPYRLARDLKKWFARWIHLGKSKGQVAR